MYHPAYGWLQDDHIYQRIIGWRPPPARWVGKLDWLFEKPGKRSAFGGWQGNMSMSLSSFFKAAWNHPLGGSWSGGESYLFSNYLQEVRVGWAYVEEHNGWRYVPGGKEGAMARLQQALAATQNWPYQERPTQERPTFAGGVMYSDIAQGLKDMWAASLVFKGEGRKENLGIFTPKGLLVLPNKGNLRNKPLGSLRFLAGIINEDHTQVSFGGESLTILGMVHTHPDPSGMQGHSPTAGDWLFHDRQIGSFVISHRGLYRAEPDFRTSTWLGPLNDKIINKYIISKYGN
jgi:hypothetical protein